MLEAGISCADAPDRAGNDEPNNYGPETQTVRSPQTVRSQLRQLSMVTRSYLQILPLCRNRLPYLRDHPYYCAYCRYVGLVEWMVYLDQFPLWSGMYCGPLLRLLCNPRD